MQEIIDKLVEAVKVKFSKEINSACEAGKQSFTKQSYVSYDDAVIENVLHDLLKYHVGRLCQKTFIYEFHKYRRDIGIPADSSSSEAFDLFVSRINHEMINDWFSKYKILAEMVTGAVENSCNYIETVCANFSKDTQLLSEKQLIKQNSKMRRIYPLDSDPHNGSKVALCFDFGESGKLIYKHRSLEFDTVIERIFNEVLCFDVLDGSPVAPTINRDSYGWQGFIEQEVLEEEELSQAYYNLGLCASVFAAIGATDLHDENVIFRSKIPYFIDLETGLKPSRRRMSNTLNEKMEDVLYESVVGTSILPAKLPTVPHQILIGAINTPYPQKTSEKIFTIKNYATDAIDIAKEIIDVKRPSSPILLKGNNTPNPVLYQTDFVAGYTFGYKRIIEKKDEMYSVLKSVNCPIRVIARPTVQYGLVLDACLFPENLIDDAAINKILAYLKPSRLVENKEIAEDILLQEIRSIRNGDIPYFYMKSQETCMRSGNYASENAFDVSPIDNAIRTLGRRSDAGLMQEIRLIAEGYSEIRLHEAKYLDIDEVGNTSLLFSDMLKKVTADNPYPIVDMIKDLAISKDEEALCGWLGGVYGDCAASYDSINFISFRDTGGIVLLFEQLSSFLGEEGQKVYDCIYHNAKCGLLSLYKKLSLNKEDEQLSIISGAASFDYIFNHNKYSLKDTEETIEELVIDEIEPGDVYKGIMGIGLLLSTYPGTGSDTLDNLYTVIDSNREIVFSKEGIAHGELGAIWTEFRLSYRLDDIAKCEELFAQARTCSFAATGWCNGNAGLLMILAEMAAVLKVESQFYDIAEKATILLENESVDLSICHGAAGVLQSLLFAYAVLGDEKYLSMANSFWKKVLKIANEKGFYTGERNRDYLLGYFLGWSGVAQAGLLLKVCNEGNIPWFPLNLSSDIYQKKLIRGEKENYAVCGGY